MTMLSAEERAVLDTPEAETHSRPEEAGKGARNVAANHLGGSCGRRFGQPRRHGPSRAAEARNLLRSSDRFPARRPKRWHSSSRNPRRFETFVLRRGDFRSHGPEGCAPAARRASGLAAAGPFPESRASCPSDEKTGRRAALATWLTRREQSADAPGDRESALAASLRPRNRRHARAISACAASLHRTPSCSTGWPRS